MNFYKHHIGDYAQATGHLTFVEDAAYCRLMRKYYAEERPIPADIKAAQRLTGARTRDEKLAVQAVLEEFFSLEADGWHSKRCDEELQKANAQSATNQRIAEEREAKRRKARGESEQARTVARTEHETLNGSLPDKEHDSFPSREPSQTPDSRLQTKASTPASTLATPPRPASPTEAGRACLLMRQAGCVLTNPNHPDLIAAIGEGVSPEALASTAAEAVEAGKAKPFAWAIATARSRHAEGAKAVTVTTGESHVRPRPESRPARLQRELEDIHRLEAAEQAAQRGDDAEAVAVDVGALLGQVVKRVG